VNGFIDLGPEMRPEVYNRLRGVCIAASWRMSPRQLLLLANDLFNEAQSRLRPGDTSCYHLDRTT
jgi:hypothetical protein